MTNKQMIEQLKNLRAHCKSMIGCGEEWEHDVEALDMAIESIESGEHLKEDLKQERKESSILYILLIAFMLIATIGVIL